MNPERALRRQPGELPSVEESDALGENRGQGIINLVKAEWISLYGRLPLPDEVDIFRERIEQKAIELGYDSFNAQATPQP